MSTFLERLINMSVTSGIIIIAIICIRLLLRKAPKVFSYALWSIVLLRLLCPVSFSSKLSAFNLVNVAESSQNGQISTMTYRSTSSLSDLSINGFGEDDRKPFVQNTNNSSIEIAESNISEGNIIVVEPTEEVLQKAKGSPNKVSILFGIWLSGVVVMLGMNGVNFLRLKRKISASMEIGKKIYLCDEIASPFCLGIFRPKIYLPSALDDQERNYVILHEQHHIHRLDQVIKLLAFLALCIHWFNPLVWVAFVLAGKDMEMSCDEAVLKQNDEDVRVAYSASLLHLATGRKVFSASSLFFGEGNPKTRIKNIIHYKKPSFWIVIVAVVTCIIVAVTLGTNPKKKETEEQKQNEISMTDDSKDQSPEEHPAEGSLTDDGQSDNNPQDPNGGVSDKIVDIVLNNLNMNHANLTGYETDLIFNFGGYFFTSNTFQDIPVGDGTPKAWHALGGIGTCIDPRCEKYAIYQDGALTDYNWLDNHSSCTKIATFTTGKYSGCVYEYGFDLFSVPELVDIDVTQTQTTSKYWIVFLSEIDNKGIHVVFLNEKYFSKEDAYRSVGIDEGSKVVQTLILGEYEYAGVTYVLSLNAEGISGKKGKFVVNKYAQGRKLQDEFELRGIEDSTYGLLNATNLMIGGDDIGAYLLGGILYYIDYSQEEIYPLLTERNIKALHVYDHNHFLVKYGNNLTTYMTYDCTENEVIESEASTDEMKHMFDDVVIPPITKFLLDGKEYDFADAVAEGENIYDIGIKQDESLLFLFTERHVYKFNCEDGTSVPLEGEIPQVSCFLDINDNALIFTRIVYWGVRGQWDGFANYEGGELMRIKY